MSAIRRFLPTDMKFDVVTIFPRMVEAGLADGVVSRGIERGLLDVHRPRSAWLYDRIGIVASTMCPTAADRGW